MLLSMSLVWGSLVSLCLLRVSKLYESFNICQTANPCMERFGEKLRVLRTKRELTTRQLAAILEVSNGYVTQIENGSKTPSAGVIVKIADVFEVSIDRLMRDELGLDED